MNPVCMEVPPVQSGDFIRALAEHQCAECIAIEGEKAEFRERTTPRILHLGDERLIDADEVDVLFSCNFLDDGAEPSDLKIDFALEWIRRVQIFTYRGQ
jgi:hypothetical protein